MAKYPQPVVASPAPARTTSTPTRKQRRKPRLLLTLLLVLAVIAILHIIAIAHPPTGPTTWHTCTDLIRNFDYTKAIPPLTGTQEMNAVQFVDELLGGQPAALIQVEDNSKQHPLDVYIFGCTLRQQTPTLTHLFEQHRLPEGTVSITGAHTLSIGQLDTSLDSEQYALFQPLQQNIFHEYRWFQGAFRQITFPGLYPVASRSEAEALQEEANNGETLPWNDPVATAHQLALDIFHWSEHGTRAVLQDNNDTTAHVRLFSQRPRLDVTVTLTRLVHSSRAAQGGLWFVTDARTEGFTTRSIAYPAQDAPLTIEGNLQSAKKHGTWQAQFFNHTLSPLSLRSAQAGKENDEIDITQHADGTYKIVVRAPAAATLLLIENIPASKRKEPGQLMLIRLPVDESARH